MADLIPVVQRLDALQARVDKLESFQLATITSDWTLRDFTDEQFLTVVLPTNGEYQGSAHLSLELPADATAARKVTAWIDVIDGTATVTGPGAGQVTLHPQLPYATLDIGPVRLVTGPTVANAVLHVQADPLSGGGGGSQVIVKASTSVIASGAPAQPRATGLIAR